MNSDKTKELATGMHALVGAQCLSLLSNLIILLALCPLSKLSIYYRFATDFSSFSSITAQTQTGYPSLKHIKLPH